MPSEQFPKELSSSSKKWRPVIELNALTPSGRKPTAKPPTLLKDNNLVTELPKRRTKISTSDASTNYANFHFAPSTLNSLSLPVFATSRRYI